MVEDTDLLIIGRPFLACLNGPPNRRTGFITLIYELAVRDPIITGD